MKEKQNVNIVQCDLDVIRAHIQNIMNKRDCTDVLFNLRVNDVLTQLDVNFWKEYAGKHHQSEFDFFVPETWVQHFKKRHRNNKLMAWWIKKHPIRTKKLRFHLSRIIVFPDVKVPKKREFENKLIFFEANVKDEKEKP
jgi:hypothetical protein